MIGGMNVNVNLSNIPIPNAVAFAAYPVYNPNWK